MSILIPHSKFPFLLLLPPLPTPPSPPTKTLLLLLPYLLLVFPILLLVFLLLLLVFLLCANVQSSRHLCVYLCVGPKTDGFDQKRLFLPPLAFLLAPPAPTPSPRNGKCVHKCLANPAPLNLSSNSLENFFSLSRELAFVRRPPFALFPDTDFPFSS